MDTSAIGQGYVNATIDSRGVGIIEFGHPLSNSMPGKVLKQLADTIHSYGQDTDVKVIVLKSGGQKAFCAGASFDELIAVNDKETGTRFFSGFANVINACRKAPKFIIGRVQGRAVGGGVGIASSVDYCLAVQSAEVKLSELAVGIGPFVVGPAIERKIGLSAMSQLAINATEWNSAQWAHQVGLYAKTYETIEELDVAVDQLAGQLSSSNPDAMRMMKRVFWEGTEHWDQLLSDRAAMSGELVLSDFTRTAIASFKAK